jgi:bifunctional non-homologous end joining protein LigD
MKTLPYSQLVLDGEVVVFDESGRPSFARLQERALLTREADAVVMAKRHLATYLVFDLLSFAGYDLRPLPLTARKEILEALVPTVGVLKFVDFFEDEGKRFYESVSELGLEGMVAKRGDSTYHDTRSSDWQKIRAMQTGDFAVIGYIKPDKRARVGFKALHLATYEDGKWKYAGAVGGGFSGKELERISKKLEACDSAEYPEARARVLGGGHVWLEPKLVVEVKFYEWLADRLLRQPTFLRERTDKAPTECRGAERKPENQERRNQEPGTGNEVEPEEAPVAGKKEVAFSNLTKVFWPEEGYTKGELIDYYREMAPWLMPYLYNRPVVLTRYPDGIAGKSFYQKDAPAWAPPWVRTETIWSEHTQRDIRYFVANDVDTLLYLANMGTIPLHVWSSKVGTLEHPDWCILDLDPKGAPWGDVIKTAQVIHELLDAVELPSFVKTSGSTGLHILIPLGGQCTYEQSRALAGLIVGHVEKQIPKIATTKRTIRQREGKVYLDWLQNRHGQLLVSPYSVRPLPGAPVSMPLAWDEVTAKLNPNKFTIKTAKNRMEKLGEDPVLPVLSEVPDLLAALRQLERQIAQSVVR